MSNRFVFIAPMHNASKTLARMLHSVCAQSYENWKIVLIDDVSEENERFKEYSIIESFDKLHLGKIFTVWNHQRPNWNTPARGKQWETSNVLYGIKRFCEDEDIVCRIDADDALVDTDALAILSRVYDAGCDCVWTMHRWGLSDRNISGPMPDDADPYKFPWVSSHLKTFRKKLINNVPYENFLNMNGELVKRCGDQALYLPVLKNAKKRFFLPHVCYSYTIDEQGGAVYQTDDARFQKQEADFIHSRGYISVGEPWESKVD